MAYLNNSLKALVHSSNGWMQSDGKIVRAVTWSCKNYFQNYSFALEIRIASLAEVRCFSDQKFCEQDSDSESCSHYDENSVSICFVWSAKSKIPILLLTVLTKKTNDCKILKECGQNSKVWIL